MAIPKALNDLLKQMLGHIFLQLSSAAHIGKKVSSSTNFHHKNNVLSCFE